MLVSTTILLLILRAPSMIIYVMWLINAKLFIQEKPPFPLRKFHSIANLCATLNAATTFVMFMIYGTKFRSEFARIFCYCFRRLKSSTNQETQTNHQTEQGGHNRLLGNNQPDDDQQFEYNLQSLPNRTNRTRRARHSSTTTTTTTTTTSVGSIPSLRRWREQRRNPRYSIEKQFALANQMPNQQLRQQESIISEIHNDNKSPVLTRSYSDCLTDFILCR